MDKLEKYYEDKFNNKFKYPNFNHLYYDYLLSDKSKRDFLKKKCITLIKKYEVTKLPSFTDMIGHFSITHGREEITSFYKKWKRMWIYRSQLMYAIYCDYETKKGFLGSIVDTIFGNKVAITNEFKRKYGNKFKDMDDSFSLLRKDLKQKYSQYTDSDEILYKLIFYMDVFENPTFTSCEDEDTHLPEEDTKEYVIEDTPPEYEFETRHQLPVYLRKREERSERVEDLSKKSKTRLQELENRLKSVKMTLETLPKYEEEDTDEDDYEKSKRKLRKSMRELNIEE